MEDHAVQKRQRTLSDTDTAFRSGSFSKRLQLPYTQPTSSVEHATATGSARMLNGHVHGNNIHGNASTVINNFHTGAYGPSEQAEIPKFSSILSTDEREELLERLRFPQLDARLTNLRKAQSHTCDWISQRKDYQEWMDSNDLQACDGFFWIKGNPGTGKSITMKFLYQKMQNKLRYAKMKDSLVISFFFNARGNEFEKSTLGLYRSLLFNLFTLEPNVQGALDHCQRGGYHNILESGWQLQMLKEVFEEAVTLLQAQGKQLYCFVDALDECPEDDVQDMVSYFEDIVSSPHSGHLRVCFSSRHYPQISIRTRLIITLEQEAKHNEDIRIFIESQLRCKEAADTSLFSQIRDEILEKSSGIFLWVNLVIYQLNEVYRQDGRMRAVQQRLRKIPEAVMKRPAPHEAMPLYGLFQDIIQKDEKKVDELVRITQIIFCARRPLHPKELYVLLHREYDVPFDSNEISDKILRKQILEVSKGLAEVTNSTQPTVQFIHETVREFLRDGGLKNISTQSVDSNGHEILRASCFEQIHAPVYSHLEILADYRGRGDYRKTRVHKVTRERQKEFQKQATDKFPFLEYASKNLLFHAEGAESLGVSQSKFLDNFPIKQWIPLYNLFEIFNTRRYSGSTTTLLYILADHGCDYLIKSSAKVNGQYMREVKDNVFSSALTCAIFSGNLDTAWTLVGLEAKARPQNMVAPPRTDHLSGHSSLMSSLLRLGDMDLMRKVLEDRQAMQMQAPIITNIDFGLINTAEMIDLLVEFQVWPGFPPVGYRHQHLKADQEASKAPRSNADLRFIRRAIEAEPSLLKSQAWADMTMLDFAFSNHLLSLIPLYLEYSDGDQSGADTILHHAAAEGNLEMVKLANRQNANFGSQNEDGKTALHLAAACTAPGDRYENTVRYLLSKDPSCINVHDSAGQTALGYALLRPGLFQSSEGNHLNSLYETFVQAGADVNALSKCPQGRDCVEHEVPLVTLMALRGEVEITKKLASDDRYDLNSRDSFGRTALSWCLAYRHGNIALSAGSEIQWQENLARHLLQQQAVDINSRDDSGYTILEHFIRYPFRQVPFPAAIFFHSERLDSNLITSNGQHPLELIVSLYDTWPIEFGDIDDNCSPPSTEQPTGECRREMRQQNFNKHLVHAFTLLLGTGQVDINVQRRCAEQAPSSELKRIILQFIEMFS